MHAPAVGKPDAQIHRMQYGFCGVGAMVEKVEEDGGGGGGGEGA